MIKILRITGVFAAISAVVVFGFFALDLVLGIQADENIQKLLNTPDVRDRFENVADSKAKTSDNLTSPLVQQAEAFALFLNPPREYTKPSYKPGVPGIRSVSPAASRPKFTVVATSYCEVNPEMSLVLIDEPGKGRHWVKQSQKVGYLVIEQIKDGLVVVKNNEETYEISISEKTGMTLLKEISPDSTKSRVKTAPKSTSFTSNRAIRNINRLEQQGNRSAEDEEQYEELVDMLKNIQQDLQTDVNESDESIEEKDEKVKKLISNFKSSRISPEEAERLGDLGEELQDVEHDPNKSLAGKKVSNKTTKSKPTGK